MRRIVIVLASMLVGATAAAQDARFAFTYQGELRASGQPANGAYDFEFALFTAPTGGAPLAVVAADDRPVSSGLFIAEINFGTTPFSADMEYWLEPRVRDGASTGGYTQLLPRQKVTPAPRALSSYTVQPGGVDSNAVQDEAIGTDQLADGSVTALKLATPSVVSEHIANGTITADDLGVDAVQSFHIFDGSVGPDELQFQGVETANLATGAVTNDKIAAGTIAADRLAFPAGDLTGLAAGAGLEGGGTSGDVALGIATNGITSGMLPDGVVRSDELATNAVATDKIQDDAVTGAKVLPDEVQLRTEKLSTGCANPNESLKTITIDGDVTCEADDGASYSAGTGISLAGNTIAILESVVPRKDGAANQAFDGGTLVIDYTNDRVGVGVPAPVQKLEVAGTVAGDVLAYRTVRTGFAWIGAPDFARNEQDDDTVGFLGDPYLLPICGASGSCDYTLHAGVDLPGEATIDDFRCWFYDTHAATNITGNAFLAKRAYGDTASTQVAGIGGFTSSSANGMIAFNATFAPELATPSTHAYTVTVFPTFGLTATVDTQRFYGCRVRYTYTQVAH